MTTTGDLGYVDADALEAGLEEIRAAPKDEGRVELIVRRPAIDEREVLDEATLDCAVGMVGDNWSEKQTTSTEDGSPHPDKQITLMNSRCVALLARTRDRWGLAGDQLYVDLALGYENLPPGTRLELGSAVVEVTDQPHRGCHKFAARFGKDALKWVNSEVGKELNLRGRNAKVVVAGTVRAGDEVRKL